MAEDDLDLDLELSEDRYQKRYKDLSQKVRETATERDNERKAREEAERLVQEAQKERDFYASYSDVVAQYPNAKDFKDDIKAKVLAGYQVDDAAIAVLGKAGKLTTSYTPDIQQQEQFNPAGGSAVNTNVARGPSDMSMDEMRAALVKAEKNGDFGTN